MAAAGGSACPRGCSPRRARWTASGASSTSTSRGAARRSTLRLDWQLARGFGRRVLQATAAIPFGAVSSYGAVAAAAGSPRASRAAGNALGANPLPIVVPCHRILHAGGGLGGYTGGVERKRVLLAIEGRI